MATRTLYLDTERQNKNFSVIVAEDSTPSLRVYMYNNGTAVTFTATHSASFVYAYSREASSYTEISGTPAVGNGYINFSFAATDIATSGKYFASIIVQDSDDSSVIVQSDGMLIINKNPGI